MTKLFTILQLMNKETAAFPRDLLTVKILNTLLFEKNCYISLRSISSKESKINFYKVATHLYQTNSGRFPGALDNFPRVFPSHIMQKLRLDSRHNGRCGKLKLSF